MDKHSFSELIARAPYGIYVVDDDFCITFMNPAAVDGAFRNVRPVIGRQFDEAMKILWPEDVAEEIVGRFRHTLETGEAFRSTDFVRPRNDVDAVEGYEWELHRVPLQDDRKGVVCYYYDSSRLRATEQALTDSENALTDANRRKDEFLATLAHELRNPLAPIRNASLLIQNASATRDQLEKATRIIERQVQQMSRLLDDLLDVARITHGKLEISRRAVALDEVLDAAVEMVQPLVRQKQHQLWVMRLPERFEVDVDPVRMTQVVSNLLVNAARYTNDGGRIELSMSVEGSDLVITVEDNGIGMSRETLATLFEMFAQGREHGHNAGLGIGLGLAKALVEMHGGSIHASSDGEGRGSRFAVVLPAVLLGSVETRDATVAEQGPALRILVVDDNQDAAESLAVLLGLEGHDAQVAHGGLDALQKLSTFRPQAALIDIGMPGMNGYELAQTIRSSPIGQQIWLGALTGWGQSADQQRAADSGFDAHTTKPAKLDVLRSLLGQWTTPRPL